MNLEIKKLWVDALRSGEYKQGFGFLEQGGKWCCYGVLCELAYRDGVGTKQASNRSVRAETCTLYDGYSAFPSDSVLDWAGIEDRRNTHLLSAMNDTASDAGNEPTSLAH